MRRPAGACRAAAPLVRFLPVEENSRRSPSEGIPSLADLIPECAMAATFVPVRLPPERLVEAAGVMGRAAVDDPIFVYAVPDAEQRVAGVPRMLETVLRIGLKHGEVWVTPPPIAGVACWISPTHPTVTA